MKQYDIAVIGAGAMGSAAAYHLAKSGKKILVLDRYAPPHSLGSSHGESRIIREAYFEHPMYVPLVRQAYALWNQLEQESGKKLFLQTGGLMISDKNNKVFSGAAASAATYGIAYDYLDNRAIKKRFPAFLPGKDMVALYEKFAGILFPAACIRAQLALSRKPNVTLQFNETVTQLQQAPDAITITTSGAAYKARKVIVSAGAWITAVIPEVKLPLEVKRQVLFWFTCANASEKRFMPENFPVFIWEYKPNHLFYGFPDLGNGIKIAIHHRGTPATADTINRKVSKQEVVEITALAKNHFDSELQYRSSAVCMYTNTPDEHFIIDYHPDNRNIIIASACSGHGFKFSSAIGKILSEMALEEKLSFDIGKFRLGRKMQPG